MRAILSHLSTFYVVGVVVGAVHELYRGIASGHTASPITTCLVIPARVLLIPAIAALVA